MYTSSIRDYLSEYEQEYLNCLDRRRPQLEALLRGMGFRPQLAKDAVDEAIAEALKLVAAREVERLDDRWAWLRTVGVNKARSICHSRWHGRKSLDDRTFVIIPGNDAEECKSKLCQTVRSVVDRLPPELRDLVSYVYLEGHTYAEAMERFGWSRSAIHGRLYRVRKILRSKLSVLMRALCLYLGRGRGNVSPLRRPSDLDS